MRAALPRLAGGAAWTAGGSFTASTANAVASTSRVTLDAHRSLTSRSVPSSCAAASRRAFTSSCQICEPAAQSPAATPAHGQAAAAPPPSAAGSAPGSASSSLSTATSIQDIPSGSAISRMSAQSSTLYVVASLAGRTFLLRPTDVVTLPTLKDVSPGDVLHLDRVHEVGTRDYALRAPAAPSLRVFARDPPSGHGNAWPKPLRAQASSAAELRQQASEARNDSLKAFAAGMPAKLADLHTLRIVGAGQAGEQAIGMTFDIGSAAGRPADLFGGAGGGVVAESLAARARSLDLRQSRTSFGALVSNHGGLAHKGPVLPALVSAPGAPGTTAITASNAATGAPESGGTRPLVQVELTVLEHTKGPLERITKTKRRKGYKRTVQHKQGYTRLRVDAIRLVQP